MFLENLFSIRHVIRWILDIFFWTSQEAAASPTAPMYFTYDVDKGICTLPADCDEIDWFSTNCIRGDGECREDYV